MHAFFFHTSQWLHAEANHYSRSRPSDLCFEIRWLPISLCVRSLNKSRKKENIVLIISLFESRLFLQPLISDSHLASTGTLWKHAKNPDFCVSFFLSWRLLTSALRLTSKDFCTKAHAIQITFRMLAGHRNLASHNDGPASTVSLGHWTGIHNLWFPFLPKVTYSVCIDPTLCIIGIIQHLLSCQCLLRTTSPWWSGDWPPPSSNLFIKSLDSNFESAIAAAGSNSSFCLPDYLCLTANTYLGDIAWLILD